MYNTVDPSFNVRYRDGSSLPAMKDYERIAENDHGNLHKTKDQLYGKPIWYYFYIYYWAGLGG